MLPTSPQGLVVRDLGRESLGFMCLQRQPKLRRHLWELKDMIKLTEECGLQESFPWGKPCRMWACAVVSPPGEEVF